MTYAEKQAEHPLLLEHKFLLLGAGEDMIIRLWFRLGLIYL